MKTSILADLFGGVAAEAVLLHLFHYGHSYGRAAARDMGVALDGVQKQLDKFERCGVLVAQSQGRTLVYYWNPKSGLAGKLKEIVGMIYDAIPLERRQEIFATRHRPRGRGKPVL
jgi:hypothetical protein